MAGLTRIAQEILAAQPYDLTLLAWLERCAAETRALRPHKVYCEYCNCGSRLHAPGLQDYAAVVAGKSSPGPDFDAACASFLGRLSRRYNSLAAALVPETGLWCPRVFGFPLPLPTDMLVHIGRVADICTAGRLCMVGSAMRHSALRTRIASVEQSGWQVVRCVWKAAATWLMTHSVAHLRQIGFFREATDADYDDRLYKDRLVGDPLDDSVPLDSACRFCAQLTDIHFLVDALRVFVARDRPNTTSGYAVACGTRQLLFTAHNFSAWSSLGRWVICLPFDCKGLLAAVDSWQLLCESMFGQHGKAVADYLCALAKRGAARPLF